MGGSGPASAMSAAMTPASQPMTAASALRRRPMWTPSTRPVSTPMIATQNGRMMSAPTLSLIVRLMSYFRDRLIAVGRRA